MELAIGYSADTVEATLFSVDKEAEEDIHNLRKMVKPNHVDDCTKVEESAS